MAVTKNNDINAQNFFNASAFPAISQSFQVLAGSNLALIVCLGPNAAAGSNPSITFGTLSATYNGVAMTPLNGCTITNGPQDMGLYAFAMLNPSVGTFNIVVSNSGWNVGGSGGIYCYLYPLALNGVDQGSVATSFINQITGGLISSSAPTLTISSQTNDLVFGAALQQGSGYAATPASGSPNAAQGTGNFSQSGTANISPVYANGTSSETFTWASSSGPDEYIMHGFDIVAVGQATGGQVVGPNPRRLFVPGWSGPSKGLIPVRAFPPTLPLPEGLLSKPIPKLPFTVGPFRRFINSPNPGTGVFYQPIAAQTLAAVQATAAPTSQAALVAQALMALRAALVPFLQTQEGAGQKYLSRPPLPMTVGPFRRFTPTQAFPPSAPQVALLAQTMMALQAAAAPFIQVQEGPGQKYYPLPPLPMTVGPFRRFQPTQAFPPSGVVFQSLFAQALMALQSTASPTDKAALAAASLLAIEAVAAMKDTTALSVDTLLAVKAAANISPSAALLARTLLAVRATAVATPITALFGDTLIAIRDAAAGTQITALRAFSELAMQETAQPTFSGTMSLTGSTLAALRATANPATTVSGAANQYRQFFTTMGLLGGFLQE